MEQNVMKTGIPVGGIAQKTKAKTFLKCFKKSILGTL